MCQRVFLQYSAKNNMPVNMVIRHDPVKKTDNGPNFVKPKQELINKHFVICQEIARNAPPTRHGVVQRRRMSQK